MTVSNIILEALREALKVIENASVDYCLFGGLAMQAYKRIRSTMDVDLIIAIDTKKIGSFIINLENRKFKFDRKKGLVKVDGLEFLRCVYNADRKYGLDVFVDFAIAKREFQKEMLRRKQKLDIFGLKVNVASCEDLILLKLVSGRPIDRIDAQVLIAENNDAIDKNYLKRWARRLGIERRINYMLTHTKGA